MRLLSLKDYTKTDPLSIWQYFYGILSIYFFYFYKILIINILEIVSFFSNKIFKPAQRQLSVCLCFTPSVFEPTKAPQSIHLLFFI
ncbi:MAG: hypothetical protein HC817_05250 [Saprospiraceae bacterium]|nr:hypothetical protein [Saprospiraceae bacterium]